MPLLIASIRAFLALVIIGRVDGGFLRIAFTRSGEAWDADRAQGLEMQDGDCTKENDDHRLKDLGDFKLEDLGCGRIKFLLECETEEFCD